MNLLIKFREKLDLKSERLFLAITRIRIEKLFGKYDYDLPFSEGEEISSLKLIIFYGDNGTGKTTLLNLIYNLLSPMRHQGNKTYLLNVRFKKFEILFNDGTTIQAYRKEKLIGSYTIVVLENSEIVLTVNLKTTRDNIIDEDYLSIRERRNLRELLRYLSDMNIGLYFISDDRIFRQIAEDSDYDDNIYDNTDFDYEKVYSSSGIKKIYIRRPLKSRKILKNILIDAKDRAEKWLNLQIGEALGKGEIDVNNIYSEIISSIAKTSIDEQITKKDISEIIEQLKNLAKRSEKYSNYKIISLLNINQIVNSIKDAPIASHKTISSILEPYIDGIKAKLDALEDIFKLLNIFIDTLNDFLFDKYIEFKFNEGFFVYTSEKEELNINALSSGEKQLLMLFCNTLPARESTCIFIIDEPEISLNVKWQRKLIQSLIELTKDKQVQFLFATHSIEILSQYRSNVANLKPLLKER